MKRDELDQAELSDKVEITFGLFRGVERLMFISGKQHAPFLGTGSIRTAPDGQIVHENPPCPVNGSVGTLKAVIVELAQQLVAERAVTRGLQAKLAGEPAPVHPPAFTTVEARELLVRDGRPLN